MPAPNWSPTSTSGLGSPCTRQRAASRNRQFSATPDLPDHVAGPTFAEVLGALRRDMEQLPQRGPVRLSDKAVRDLDRKKIILGHVDAEGDHHVQVFEGDTDAGWRVRDWLARESKK